eukprot:4925623-Alexandrium_andersonii.AAC.1
MHNKHLGCDQYFYGSVLQHLCFHIIVGTPADNLAALAKHLLQYYKDHPGMDHFSEFKLKMFTSDSTFPRLKGRALLCRNLGPALLDAFLKYKDPAVQQHREVEVALVASTRMEAILKEYEDAARLPDGAQAEL